MFSFSKANTEKNAPNIWYSGAPGGWPTWSLDDVVMYSPVSQKLTVGSAVVKYTKNDIRKHNQPNTRFIFLYESKVFNFFVKII